jgi:hypothetical protein
MKAVITIIGLSVLAMTTSGCGPDRAPVATSEEQQALPAQERVVVTCSPS